MASGIMMIKGTGDVEGIQTSVQERGEIGRHVHICLYFQKELVTE